MQFGLTEEQELIVSTVRSFVETEIYPLEDEVEKLGHVPVEMGHAIRDRVLEMGFYAANFPEAGVGPAERALAVLPDTSWSLVDPARRTLSCR